ncbi:hypothetical protein PVAND_004523 [Polypedilum vanderplanki]|uniref:T-cell activation inhibitor, mitochondrial n=1 Tax=Polypedilum vanderplanki TaxID=319348 RepID=A0A9J6BX85_POLVA|nr:hypothetical protein PVAND_004523 [Polypedilum vanderplanki]
MQFCASKFCLSLNKNQTKKYGYFGKIIFMRHFTSSQLQTALRPFFFLCHPDLFYKFPMERAINENSLKVLSGHLDSLQRHVGSQTSSNHPSSIPFYLRSKDKSKPFKLVKVPLHNEPLNSFVTNILRTCDLETSYVEKISSQTQQQRPSTANFNNRYRYEPPKSDNMRYKVDDKDVYEEYDLFQFKVRKAREDETLSKFVKKNLDLAQIRTKALDELREEVEKLKIELESKLQLKEILYSCGFNYEHFRGYLKSLEKLHDLHADDMTHLCNKKVIFSNFSGVSLEGDVHLFTGDVQNNWLELFKNIPQHEVYLKTIPMYENTLSKVLLDIKITRRKFMPKIMAKSYSSHLSRVVTTLLDYLSKNKYPEVWPSKLKDYELVVESESAPLSVGITGQFLLPSACPAFLIVDFITKNLEEAKIRKIAYNKHKHIEKSLRKQCKEKFKLQTLLKDDNITPEMMIECMEKLIRIDDLKLNNLNLHITNYYSILQDGTVCIPFNFKS